MWQWNKEIQKQKQKNNWINKQIDQAWEQLKLIFAGNLKEA